MTYLNAEYNKKYVLEICYNLWLLCKQIEYVYASFIINFKRKDLENLFLCKNITQTDWMTVVCYTIPAEPTFWEAKLNEQKKFAKRAKQVNSDSFHLYLFDFPLIYQFYAIMNTLVRPTCWNPTDRFISPTFQKILIRSVS